MITTIEELSLNAWPSHQTVFYDGWVLRFANGYTRRANSVNPIYPSSISVDEKLRFCEQIYQNKKMSPIFKITSAVYPGNLDEKLATSGYRRDAPTSVQTLALETISTRPSQGASLQEDLPESWLAAYCRMSAVAGPTTPSLRQILLNIIPRHCFISLSVENQIIACGLGVLQAGYLGLFDIVTDPLFRKQGFARQIVNSLLAWGKQNQALTAYLQVMLNNAPALNLYSSLGFTEIYQYWYRIKAN